MDEEIEIKEVTILGVAVEYACINNELWINATKAVKNFNEENNSDKSLDTFWDLDLTKKFVRDLSRNSHDSREYLRVFDGSENVFIQPELGVLLTRYFSMAFTLESVKVLFNSSK